MFEKVLVGYLDGERGIDALALGDRLASACGAPIEIVTAAEGENLNELVRSRGGDLLVLGSSHRAGLGRVVPGTTADQLLGQPPCAIAVSPPGFGQQAAAQPDWRPLDGDGGDSGMRVIGVGFDGSPASRGALDAATELALANGSALRVYTVAHKHPNQTGAIPLSDALPGEAESFRQQLDQAVRELPREVRALPVFLRGFEADELIKAAGLGVDLLVLGSRPGGPVRRHLHRSVSNLVLARSRCPVLIVPTAVAAGLPA